MKIAVICRGSVAFLKPLIDHWKDIGYTLVDTLRGADAVFVEWGNAQSVGVTRESSRKNVVIRVHGSEYFQGFHRQWAKENVFAVIKANPVYEIPGVSVVDCGIPIDGDFWQAAPDVARDPRRLLMVGSFVYSKNHIGLLQILSTRPDYFKEIIFVGDTDARDNPYRYAETKKTLAHIDHYAARYKLPVCVLDKMTPEDLRALYTTCGYIVSNSINEGFHLTIGEGILCGCKPLIYDWAGAAEIYGLQTYHNGPSFWRLVEDYPYQTQAHLKGEILNRFDKTKVFETIDATLFEAARAWL